MALQKEVRSFALTESLNSKVDPKLLPLPKLLIAENARFTKSGRISKRFGCESLATGVVGSTDTIEDADALGVYNDELLVFADQSVFSYSEQAMLSANKGGCVSASVSIQDVSRSNYDKYHVDSFVYNNITLVAYEDQRGGIYVTVIDNVTGTATVSDTNISSTGVHPRCLAFQGYMYVLYVEGNNLKGLKLDPTDPLNSPTFITVTSAVNGAAPNFDAIVHDTFILVGFNVQGAAQLRLIKLNNNLAIQATTNIAEAATDTVGLVRGVMSHTHVLWRNATGVRHAIVDVFIAVLVAAADVEVLIPAYRITGYLLPDESGIQIYYDVPSGSTYEYGVKTAFIANDGTVSGVAVFLLSVGLAGKAFAYSKDETNHGFVPIVHDSTLQATFFVARNDKRIVAKAQYGYAAGVLLRRMAPTVSEVSTGKFQFAVLSKSNVISENRSGFTTLRGVSLIDLDFSDLRNFSSAQLADNAIIVGGTVQSYDSQSAVEQGFHLFPENITAVASNGAGALTSSTQYAYQITYEWTDNRGQVHRSAPSIPVTVTMGGTDDTVTLTIHCLCLTQKTSPRAEINIVVYRTEANGAIFYQASSPTTLTFNDPNNNTITYVDLLSDTDLISRQPIYTTGGVIENIAPPSASLIAAYRNRIILGGTEDDTVWFSKEVKPSRPVEFTDSFIIKVDPIGGRLTAIATMDDKIILFKENSIFYTGGDGPNDLGAAGSFLPPESVPSDVGCIDSKSVVVTPAGVAFKSRKGYYLLSRALETEYVGAPVEEFNDFEVSAAVLVADDNEVRFCTVDGPILVYNYFFNTWSIWPDFRADDAIVWRNTFVAIKSRVNNVALVVKEVKDFFQDINQKYSLKIGLAFAAFAQIQGFQRIWRTLLLGSYKSPHQLKVSVGYDYMPFISDEYYWDPVARTGITEYGDGAFYGSDPVYGGGINNLGLYQIRVHVVRQKCQAIRVIVEDMVQEGTYESYDLSSIAFEMGVKKGSMKLQAAQTL